MHVHRVAFLACGWALASKQTHGTAIALETEEGTVLVDAGGEVSKGLVNTFGLGGLARIYLTHEHPDHTWALPGLLHCLRFAGDRGPLTIHGPGPAIERAKAAVEALGVLTPFELAWHKLGASSGEDGWCRWAPADHSVQTVSYRFGDVTVCGDTAPALSTVELSRGSSLLVHEATHTDEERTHSAGHATPNDAGEIARKAGVQALAMIHRHPALSAEEALEQAGFPMAFAPRDGDVLQRPEGTWEEAR